jgi:lysophospholipase L1-like esterase
MAWRKPYQTPQVNVNVLNGKRIGVIGSSSADVGDYGENYWEHIEKRTGAIILDYADGGSTLTAKTINYSAEPTNQLKRIDDLPITNIDVVVVQPALNDDNSGRPIGHFESRSVTDVYGALHVMCQKLYDKYPTLPIGVMTGQYYGNKTARSSKYHEAIKEVCSYYGIPVCDLKSEGRTPYSYTNWQKLYAADGLHLNDLGSLVLSRRVEAFVRMLFGY